jgi:hypothetical protein
LFVDAEREIFTNLVAGNTEYITFGEAGRSMVLFLMRSLDFSVDIIFLAALPP